MSRDDPFRRISLPLPHSRSLLSKYHPQLRPLPLSHHRESNNSSPTPTQHSTLKEVMREKAILLSGLNASTNQQAFMQHRQYRNQKTLSALRKKWQKIASVRRSRKDDQKELDEAMERWNTQILNRNHRAKREVKESRIKTINSRAKVCHLKSEIGEEVRRTSQHDRELVIEQKMRWSEHHKQMAESVRQKEHEGSARKQVSTERKKHCANEVKLDRLQRELAQKQEIQVLASHRAQGNRQLLDRMRRQANVMQHKIDRFRKSLAQRRLPTDVKGGSAGTCSTRSVAGQRERRSLTLNFTEPQGLHC